MIFIFKIQMQEGKNDRFVYVVILSVVTFTWVYEYKMVLKCFKFGIYYYLCILKS